MNPIRTVSAVLATAVVSAVLLASCASPGSTGAGGRDPLAGVVGHRWRVVALHDAKGSADVRAQPRAEIGFTTDGEVMGDDTVNSVSGHYRREPAGYSVHGAASTLVGFVGTSEVRNRLIDAVDGMFLAEVARPGDPAPTVAVTVTLRGTTLTLRRGATALTLERAGAQPGAGTPSLTTTPSTTTGQVSVPGSAGTSTA